MTISIAVKDLLFDYESPRLPVQIESDADMLEWLLDVGDVRELMLSIGERGFFSGSPLLVVEEREGYKVVDGNRRLAAVKLLRKPDLVDRRSVRNISRDSEYKPPIVPCLVFSDREVILQHMGFTHISGEVRWGTLAKAHYFEQHSHISSLDQIARSVGVRKRYVQKLLSALVLFQEVAIAGFYGIEDLNETSFSFAFFLTALDYPCVDRFIEQNDDGLEKMVRWFYEKEGGMRRISSASALGKLNEVLQSPQALARFEEGAVIDSAYRIARMEE